jgi:hypothetical protein
MVVDPKHTRRDTRWLRNRAEEVRTAAEDMHDPDSRRTLLLIAAAYETIANHLETAAEHLTLPSTG